MTRAALAFAAAAFGAAFFVAGCAAAPRVPELVAPTVRAGNAIPSYRRPIPAQATQCDAREKVLALLARKYKETPIAAGVTSTGGLVEVLSDGKGGTWTIIVTTPEGLTCLVAAGEGWRQLEAVQADSEA